MLMDYDESIDASRLQSDEVSCYKSIPLSSVGLNQQSLLTNQFSVVQFWYNMKRTFSLFCNASMRVFATPAFSCANSRVFSTVHKLISPELSSMLTDVLADMIVACSLLSKSTNNTWLHACGNTCRCFIKV